MCGTVQCIRLPVHVGEPNNDTVGWVQNISAAAVPGLGIGLPAGATAYLGTVTFRMNAIVNGTFEIEVGVNGPYGVDGVVDIDGYNIEDTTAFNSAWLITEPPEPDEATGTADGGGGTVSTGTIATSSDPVETSVTVPPGTAGGEVAIYEGAITETPPSGFSFLGQQMDITAPDGTVANPLVLTFSLFAPGMDPDAGEIFKAAVLVADCVDPGGTSAMPDPCVESRTPQGADNIVIVVRTSMASLWNLPEPGLLLQLASGVLALLVLGNGRRRYRR